MATEKERETLHTIEVLLRCHRKSLENRNLMPEDALMLHGRIYQLEQRKLALTMQRIGENQSPESETA